MTGARDITRLCFSSNLAGIVVNKIKQLFLFQNRVNQTRPWFFGVLTIPELLFHRSYFPFVSIIARFGKLPFQENILFFQEIVLGTERVGRKVGVFSTFGQRLANARYLVYILKHVLSAQVFVIEWEALSNFLLSNCVRIYIQLMLSGC